jgi:WD40 repeat protein
MMTRTILPLAAIMATILPASAAEPDFYRDVYPFLKTNCISCHNKTTTKADLNMETPELMLKGGESGPSVVPGKSAESLVVQASLHQHDMEMPPPKNKSGAQNLTQAEVSILKQWIDQGAKSSVQQERVVAWKPLAAGVHPIYSVAMTKDGRYAACGRSNHIFVYDLATRQLVAQVSDPAEKAGAAHRALVQSLAFSPDGTRLASGSFREVKIWRLERAKASDASKIAGPLPSPASEAVLKKLSEAAKTGILSHSMSGDGKRIVTGCADGSVRVWDTAALKTIIELRGSVSARQKSAELEWAVAAQSLEQAFQKSETTRIEAQNKALDELLKKANEAIVAMKKVLPEKQKAVQPATVAKAAAQKEVDDVMTKVKASPGGKPDAALDKELKAAQNKLITAKIAERSVLAAVSAAESNVKDADEDVKRITGTKTQNAKLLAAANAAADAAKKIQEKAAADLAALKQSIAKSTAKPLAVTFSADAQRVAAMFDDGALRVWAVATGTPIEEKAGNSSPAITLVPGADGSFTATKGTTLSAGGTPQWTLERTLGGEKQHGLFADRLNAVCFSPDGKTLATGGGEPTRAGDIILFDVATGKATQTWKECHTDAVLGLDFSPDGKLLASGAADKLAKVTDIATGKQVNLFEGHTHHVMDVAFRADGRVLATAGADGVVLTWDMISGERKKKIEGWTKEVTSLQFIGATNQIVTSAGDNRVRVVTDEGAEIRSIAGLPDYMQASLSTPDGGTIIGGGEDSFLRVWDGSNGKEIAAFGGK